MHHNPFANLRQILGTELQYFGLCLPSLSQFEHPAPFWVHQSFRSLACDYIRTESTVPALKNNRGRPGFRSEYFHPAPAALYTIKDAAGIVQIPDLGTESSLMRIPLNKGWEACLLLRKNGLLASAHLPRDFFELKAENYWPDTSISARPASKDLPLERRD